MVVARGGQNQNVQHNNNESSLQAAKESREKEDRERNVQEEGSDLLKRWKNITRKVRDAPAKKIEQQKER